MASDVEIMDRGMACLLDGLGAVDTERFLSFLARERFDYTEWRRRRFDGVGPDELLADAIAYNQRRPFSRMST